MLWIFRSAGAKNTNNKKYQFWKQDSHAEQLISNKFMEQKLDYIHANPVVARLVDEPEEYVYSSARDYAGRKGALTIEMINWLTVSKTLVCHVLVLSLQRRLKTTGIGAAAVPSAGLIMMIIVLQSVGLNPAWIAIIFPIDRPLDMFRTVVNVSGDATVSTLIAKSEGELQKYVD